MRLRTLNEGAVHGELSISPVTLPLRNGKPSGRTLAVPNTDRRSFALEMVIARAA